MEKQSRLIYCGFPKTVPTSKHYVCFNKEQCCDEGCCLGGPYQVYQIWILILIILGVIFGGAWLCKKPVHTSPRRRNSSSNNRCSATSTPRPSRVAGEQEGDEEVVLDRLLVSFKNRNATGDPPSYSSAVSSGKNGRPPYACYAFYGPPPSYSAARTAASSDASEPAGNRSAEVEVDDNGRASAHSSLHAL